MTALPGSASSVRSRLDRAEVAELTIASGVSVEVMRTSYRAQRFPKHSHDFYTIGLVLRGIGSLWYRGAERLTHPGEVVVIPPGEIHTGSLASGADVLEYVAAHVPAELVTECADGNGGRDRTADLEAPVLHDNAVATQLRRLEGAMAIGPSANGAADEALTAAIDLLVHRHPRADRAAPRGRGEPRVVRVAREILDDCFDDNKRTALSELAFRAGVTPFHLVRVFTRAVGLSPHQYLVQKRIHHAARLLAGGMSCSIVAATTGFSDQSHLTMQFKRYLGITPALYQRCLRG
jgi:AraC-like DNA-binding protein/quercetin dioxygenase-like cupin family protein